MRQIWLCIALAVSLTGVFTESAFAWFDCGHMEVAGIAYGKLTPQTKERVNALLKLNPYYDDWNKKIPDSASPSDREMMIFMLAATWPDAIKNDAHYSADGAEAGNKPDGPGAAENLGYSDHRLHKYWHYKDIPFSKDGTKLPVQAVPNAETQINAFRAVLASDSADELKSYDLTWLIHLVGDVHQPLHCATRISRNSPNGDKGGNDVRLNGSPEGVSNLHALWDAAPGTDREVGNVVQKIHGLPDANAKQAAKLDPKGWIAESHKLALKKVYRSPIQSGNGPFTLTRHYTEEVQSIASRRVALAGARLANLLNGELK